MNAIMC